MQESKALARLGLGTAITVLARGYLPLGGLSGQLAVPAMYAHFINVGQAAAALLEFPCGAVLVDAGSPYDATQAHLINYLNKFFNRRSDINRTFNAVISRPQFAILEMLRPVLTSPRSTPLTIQEVARARHFQDYTTTSVSMPRAGMATLQCGR